MNHLNSILLEGIVVNDPEVKATSCQSGAQLVVLRMASHRYYRDQDTAEGRWKDDTLFMDVLAWGGLGRKVMELIPKGTTVRVVGRLKVSLYKSRDGAREYSRPSIVAQHIEFRRRRNADIVEGHGASGDVEDITLNAEGGDENTSSLSEPVVIYEY